MEARPESRARFLELLTAGHTVSAAAKGAGVTRDAAYKWKQRGDKEVERALEAAAARGGKGRPTPPGGAQPSPPLLPPPAPPAASSRRPSVPEGLEAEIRAADTVALLAAVGRRVTVEILRGAIEPRVGDLVIGGLREQRQAMRMRMLEQQERAVAAIEVLTPEEVSVLEAHRAAKRPRPLEPGEAALPPGESTPVAPPPAADDPAPGDP